MDTIVGVAIVGSVVAGIIAIAPTVKMGLDMAPYLYANTRCSSRTGLLLKKKEYDQLISSSSMQELYALLEDSYYGDLVEHAKQYGNLSEMLGKDLFGTYSWLGGFIPKKLSPIIEAIRMKFEIANLKDALNSCAKGESPKDLEYIEDESLRIRLESCKDIDSYVAAIKDTVYEDVVGQNTAPSVSFISNQLDILYYRKVSEEIRLLKDNDGAVVFRDFWRKQIDLVNLRLTLRRIAGVSDITLIDGGYIAMKDLQSATDAMQLESVVSKSIYKEFIDGVSSTELETALYRSFLKESTKVNAKHSLKTGTVVRFIIQKEIEIRNLNIITKLKGEDYDNSDIEKLVIM